MFWRTYVLTPPGGLVTALSEQREKPSLAGCPHPFDPLRRAVQLLRTRQRLRPTPGPVERPDPVGSHHLVGEGLAAPVLGELHLQAEDLGHDRVEQAPPVAIAVESAPQAGVAGVELL